MKKLVKQIRERIKKLQEEPTDVNIGKVAELNLVAIRLQQLILPGVVEQNEQLRFLIDKFQTPKGNQLIDLLMAEKERKDKNKI
jgi:hypothetical protein